MLKVNKEHIKTDLPKNTGKKLFLSIESVLISLTLFSGALAVNKAIDAYETRIPYESLVEISPEERHSIYYENDIFIFSEKDSSLYENKQIDVNITQDVLDQVEYLTLDMLKHEDLSLLEKYHNLKNVNLYNAQMLTSKDINYINNSSLESVNLEFDANELGKMPANSFDMGLFTKRIEASYHPYGDEVYDVIFASRMKNIPEYLIVKEDIAKGYALNQKLDEILEYCGADKETDEWTKMLKIMAYVNKHIEYDIIVLFSQVNDDLKHDADILSREYNINKLSSVLNGKIDEVVTGICINYAELFTVLCYKANINVVTIHGELNQDPHAWNLINLENEYRQIDLTNSDDWLFDLYIDRYNAAEESEKSAYSDTIKEIIFEKFDGDRIIVEYGEMPLGKPLEFKKIQDNYNDPENINTSKNNILMDGRIFMPVMLGLSTGLIAFVTPNFYKIKKKFLNSIYDLNSNPDNLDKNNLPDKKIK